MSRAQTMPRAAMVCFVALVVSMAWLVGAQEAAQAPPSVEVYVRQLRRTLGLIRMRYRAQRKLLETQEERLRECYDQAGEARTELLRRLTAEDDSERRKELGRELDEAVEAAQRSRRDWENTARVGLPRLDAEVAEAVEAIETKLAVLERRRPVPERFCERHGSRLEMRFVPVVGPGDLPEFEPGEWKQVTSAFPLADWPYCKGGVPAWSDEVGDWFLKWICSACADGKRRWLADRKASHPATPAGAETPR